MLRHQAMERSLSGNETRLIRRRLTGCRLLISTSGAYKVATINTNGHKVVGAYIRQQRYVDQLMKTFRRYYGKGPVGQDSSAFIASLDNERIESRIGQVYVQAGPGEHIYLAQPKEAGLAVLSYGGLAGGFKLSELSLTDPVNGALMQYYVWESVHDNLGAISIEIN